MQPVQISRFESHQAVYIINKPIDSFFVGMDGFDPLVILAYMDRGYIFVTATDARTGESGSVIVPFSNIRYMQPLSGFEDTVEIEPPLFGDGHLEDESTEALKAKPKGKVGRPPKPKPVKDLNAPPPP